MSIELIEVDGLKAREMDNDHLEWPPDARVVFAIEDGKIVGRTSAMPLPTIRVEQLPLAAILTYDLIEGTWVREDKRGGSLAVKLIRFVEDIFRRHQKTHAVAFTYEAQPEVGEYLERFGYKKVPFLVWQKQLVPDEAEKAA